MAVTELGLQHPVEIGLVVDHMAPPTDRAEHPQDILEADLAPAAEPRTRPQRHQQEQQQRDQSQCHGWVRQGPVIGLEMDWQGAGGGGPVGRRRRRGLKGRYCQSGTLLAAGQR